MALKLNPFGKKGQKSGGRTEAVAEVDRYARIPPRDIMLDIEVNRNVIQIGKTRYAVGLNWKGITADSPKKQLESNSSGDTVRKRDLYVTTRDAIGFGSTSEMGHKKGMPPLALALDPAIVGRNFAAAFKLGTEDKSKWWVVKSYEGMIFPDSIVSSEDQARNFLHAQIPQDDETIRIIAPQVWDIPESVSADLKDVLLLDPSRVPKMRYFGAIRNNLPMILLLTLVGIASTVGYIGFEIMEQRKAELARLERERLKNRVSVENEDYPWFGSIKVADFIDACQDGFGRLMVQVPGWDIQPLACTMDTSGKGSVTDPRSVRVSATWLRSDIGRTDWLRAAFPSGTAMPSVSGDGRTASLSLKMNPKFDESYFRNKPWDPQKIGSVVVERFINYGVRAVFGQDVKSVRGKIETPIFNGHNFSVVSQFDPKEWVGLINDVPAAVPISMSWNPSTNEWAFSGRIYHPAILPIGAY